MNRHENRVIWTRRLIADREQGNKAEFARKIETDPNYLYTILSGGRNMGDDLARRIERVYELDQGRLDLLPEMDERMQLSDDAVRIARQIDAADPAGQQAFRAMADAIFHGPNRPPVSQG